MPATTTNDTRTNKRASFPLRPTKRAWMVLAVVCALTLSVVADAANSAGSVRPGVKVGSLSIGGRKYDDAEAALTRRAKQIAGAPASFTAGETVVNIRPQDISFLPEVDATLRAARRIGRRGNIAVRTWHRLRTLFASTDVDWASTYDRERAEEIASQWAGKFNNPGHEAGIRAEGTSIKPVEPQPGTKLNIERAVDVIVDALETWPRKTTPLPLESGGRKTDAADAARAVQDAEALLKSPITLTSPAGNLELSPADLAVLLDAVPRKAFRGWDLRVRFSPDLVKQHLADRMKQFERPAQDAGFAVSGDSVSVRASQDGLQFDPEKTAKALDAIARGPAPRTAEAAFAVAPPKLTTEQAQALRITQLVSTFTTRHPAGQPRVTNIHKAADAVSGAIVRPGEVFSLNKHVGERTPAKGYVMAPMIYDGEFKDQFGGGVSQLAATMFNAVFFGGYEFVTFKAHSYFIPRYPAGREATISWPAPDFKFKNNSSSGVLIKTAYSGSSITVSLYGTKEFGTITADEQPRTNVTEPAEKRTPDPGVPPGQERVKQAGVQGFDITIFRVFTKDGKVVRRQKFFTRYLPEPKIIAVGPGSPAPASGSPPPAASPAPSASP